LCCALIVTAHSDHRWPKGLAERTDVSVLMKPVEAAALVAAARDAPGR
jgi:hypothetical protein